MQKKRKKKKRKLNEQRILEKEDIRAEETDK